MSHVRVLVPLHLTEAQIDPRSLLHIPPITDVEMRVGGRCGGSAGGHIGARVTQGSQTGLKGGAMQRVGARKFRSQ